MSRFFVGQRVRVVGAHDAFGRKVVGMEGLVNELDCVGGWGETGMVGVTLPVPSAISKTFDGWCFAPHELEPILPEGHRPCEEQFKCDLDRLLEREGVSA